MNAWIKLDKLDQLDVGNLSKKEYLSKDFQILKNRSIYQDGFWDSYLSFAEERLFFDFNQSFLDYGYPIGFGTSLFWKYI